MPLAIHGSYFFIVTEIGHVKILLDTQEQIHAYIKIIRIHILKIYSSSSQEIY
jgi:hypothetical protein